MSINLRPRNDFVIFRRRLRKVLRGNLVMPERSAKAADFIIEAIGSDVTDLDIGDKVMLVDQPSDIGNISGSSDLFITRQQFVAVVIELEEIE